MNRTLALVLMILASGTAAVASAQAPAARSWESLSEADESPRRLLRAKEEGIVFFSSLRSGLRGARRKVMPQIFFFFFVSSLAFFSNPSSFLERIEYHSSLIVITPLALARSSLIVEMYKKNKCGDVVVGWPIKTKQIISLSSLSPAFFKLKKAQFFSFLHAGTAAPTMRCTAATTASGCTIVAASSS